MTLFNPKIYTFMVINWMNTFIAWKYLKRLLCLCQDRFLIAKTSSFSFHCLYVCLIIWSNVIRCGQQKRDWGRITHTYAIYVYTINILHHINILQACTIHTCRVGCVSKTIGSLRNASVLRWPATGTSLLRKHTGGQRLNDRIAETLEAEKNDRSLATLV